MFRLWRDFCAAFWEGYEAKRKPASPEAAAAAMKRLADNAYQDAEAVVDKQIAASRARRGTVLKPGYQWAGGDSPRATGRRMRQSLRRAAGFKDAESIRAMARLRAAVAGEPDPEMGAMQLAHSAILASEGLRAKGVPCTWAHAINYLLDKFDGRPSGHLEG
jgi:hypothetical protein